MWHSLGIFIANFYWRKNCFNDKVIHAVMWNLTDKVQVQTGAKLSNVKLILRFSNPYDLVVIKQYNFKLWWKHIKNDIVIDMVKLWGMTGGGHAIPSIAFSSKWQHTKCYQYILSVSENATLYVLEYFWCVERFKKFAKIDVY